MTGAVQPFDATLDNTAGFRRLADCLPTLCWVANADGYIFWYNRAWHEYCGTTPAQMEGWGWQSVHDPALLPAVLERWRAAIAGGTPFEMTFPLRGADGVFRPFLTRVQPVRDKAGQVARWFGVNTDVSPQQAAEDALRAERDRSRGILDSMGEGFMLLDHGFRILAVNAEGLRLNAGQNAGQAETLVGQVMWDAYPGAEDSEPGRLNKRAMAERVPVALEHLYAWPDGRRTWLDMRSYPVPEGLAVFYRDVTDRRGTTDRLRDSEARLNAVLDALPVSVVIADAAGRLLRDNAAHRTLWGAPPDIANWKQYGEYVGFWPDTGERVQAQEWGLARALLRGETIVNELVESQQFGTGERRFFLNNAAPIRDGDGTILGAVVAELDVTEARRAQAALRASEARLRELNETLERRVEEEVAQRARTEEALRQSQKMEAVGQLTGGLAHDFNNLLAGISGSLELLQSRLAQGRLGDLDRYLLAAQGAAKRAASLTHRLLAFSRRQTLDPRPTDLNRLVAGMEELVRRTVGPSTALEVVAAGGLWATMIDPGQLENALLNLCLNARDAMPRGGRLTVETGNRWLDERAAASRDLPPGQYVSLCVSDTGTGMPPEVAGRAFDPFFTTKPIGMGTGLGLSMVHGFVRQSGGQARIYSEPGGGTMVCLYLPRFHGVAVDAERPAGREGSAAPGHVAGETVLVVDDEPTVRMLVAEVLEDLGYTAIEASDGPSGVEVLRSDARIDLLISDVGLPGGLNGRQVADAGRAVRPGLRVLFITGYAENAVLGNGHLDPGMHVMTKPFAMTALATRIRAIMEAA